jgi:hypothetical protein
MPFLNRKGKPMAANVAAAVVLFLWFLVVPVSAKMYYWIDENGVKRFSSEPPPEGAVVIEKFEEVPHDASEARQIEREQEQTWQELERIWEERREKEAAEERRRQEALEAERQRAEEERLRQEQEKEALRQKRYEKGTYEQKRRRRERAEQPGAQ